MVVAGQPRSFQPGTFGLQQQPFVAHSLQRQILDGGKPSTKPNLSEAEHVSVLEGQVNALEVQNQHLTTKIHKAHEYLWEIGDMTASNLEKDVDKQLVLSTVDSSQKDKMLRYYKEQKTLLKVFAKI